MSDGKTLVRGEVVEAQAAIMHVVRDVAETYPDHRWRAFDLRSAARNGGDHGALGIALDDLIERGELVQDPESQLIGLPTAASEAT